MSDNIEPMIRTFNVRARIGPRYDPETHSTSASDFLTLTLSVSDGPETWGHFDTKVTITAESEGYTDVGNGTLVDAIEHAVNNMIGAALECEAFEWVNNHDEVYLVCGDTGRDEDHQSWNVKAFLNKTYALDRCRELNELMFEHGLHVREPADWRHAYHRALTLKSIVDDPGFEYDAATGTVYTVVAIKLDARHAWDDSRDCG